MKTCQWCGKQFDYDSFSRGSHSTAYCCGRCYNAAKREEERKRQKNKEEAEKFEKDHPLLSSIFKLFIIGYFAIMLILVAVKERKNKEQITKEAAQETVVTQPPVVIESEEQIKEVANQLERVEISENTYDDIMPEALNMVDEPEVEEVFESEEMELEEEVRLDFSKQRVYQIYEVDEEPHFLGGEQKLLEFIAENVNYPQEAIDEAIQGRVFVNFIVEPDGGVSNAKVLRGIGYGCDEEAIRVIESLSTWKPGRRRDREVRVAMTVPVFFNLH